MHQSETLVAVCAKKFFLGYLLFSCVGVALIVAAVNSSTSWEAVLAGWFFIAGWSGIFLVLQLAIFAIRVDPLRRFLTIAAITSFVNLIVGVPAVTFLFQVVYRWSRS